MLTLGIESSCDETSVAVVKDGREILSNIISSQIEIHRLFGGVVPEIASRKHVSAILPVIDLALEEAKITMDDDNAFAAGAEIVSASFNGAYGVAAHAEGDGIVISRTNHLFHNGFYRINGNRKAQPFRRGNFNGVDSHNFPFAV